MYLFAKRAMVAMVVGAVLNACVAHPQQCTCRPSPPPTPPNAPCNNCYDNCKDVPTLNDTLGTSVRKSPFFKPLLTASSEGNGKEIDCACITYLTLGDGRVLQFTCHSYVDNTYSVEPIIVSDTSNPGELRSEGLATISGISSFVTNAFTFGAVSCPSCSTQPITCIYSCSLFVDCSLPLVQSDVIYCISDTPYIAGACLDQAQGLFGQSGLQPGVILRPQCLNPVCVTSFNGAPVINADKAASYGIAYPPPPCNCTSNY